jgi:hypothetical protein
MSMNTRIAAALAAGVWCGAAWGQEAMYTEAATMPGPGNFILREQIHFYRYGENPVSGDTREDKYELENILNIGLARAWSVMITVPVVVKESEPASGPDVWDRGVEDIDVVFKYRVYMDNTGGVDTLRVALLGGASVASGDDRDFSSQSVNPMIGAVVTKVSGRHGFNQDLKYTFNTGGTAGKNTGGDGPDDALAFNSAYVFRFYPSAYTAESQGAWYVTAEINGLYETNGDTELRWAPGVMYEGRRFGWEIMAQFPLWNELDERAELDFAVGMGVRLLF